MSSPIAILIPLLLLITMLAVPLKAEDAKPAERCFEMRTYTAAAGKMEALHKRFRDHTNRLFAKNGITIIGYWTPTDGETAGNTLVYVLAYPSRAAADESWKNFRADPEWVKAKGESEADGKLVDKVVSVFMKPTDYSPIK